MVCRSDHRRGRLRRSRRVRRDRGASPAARVLRRLAAGRRCRPTPRSARSSRTCRTRRPPDFQPSTSPGPGFRRCRPSRRRATSASAAAAWPPARWPRSTPGSPCADGAAETDAGPRRVITSRCEFVRRRSSRCGATASWRVGRRRSGHVRQDRDEARRAQGAPDRRAARCWPASPAAQPTASRCSRSSRRSSPSTRATCCAPRSNWPRIGARIARCAGSRRCCSVGDAEHLLVLSGTGDVIEPDEGIAAIGSGGPYAQAAAMALLRNTTLVAEEIAREALEHRGARSASTPTTTSSWRPCDDQDGGRHLCHAGGRHVPRETLLAPPSMAPIALRGRLAPGACMDGGLSRSAGCASARPIQAPLGGPRLARDMSPIRTTRACRAQFVHSLVSRLVDERMNAEVLVTDPRALTPRAIVAELDKYIVGQAKAKRAVAIAMRNRYRREQRRGVDARRDRPQEHPDDRSDRRRQDGDRAAARDAGRRAVRQGRGDEVHRGRLRRAATSSRWSATSSRPRSGWSKTSGVRRSRSRPTRRPSSASSTCCFRRRAHRPAAVAGQPVRRDARVDLRQRIQSAGCGRSRRPRRRRRPQPPPPNSASIRETARADVLRGFYDVRLVEIEVEETPSVPIGDDGRRPVDGWRRHGRDARRFAAEEDARRSA